MTEVLLKTNQFVVGYPERPLSSPMTMEVPSGVRVGIIGANGSGKSTLVRTLLGLLPPLGGNYQWAEKITHGYVPQEDQISSIFPLTVMDLLKMGGMGKSHSEQTTTQILEELELTPLRKKLFRELSRGQKQRVLIARALIGNPSVLVLDEPYSALDDLFREKLWRLFEQWKKQNHFSLFLIEHDLNRVVNQVDWIILLGPHGTVVGPVSEILSEEVLNKAYGSKIHLYKDNHEIQIHFL